MHRYTPSHSQGLSAQEDHPSHAEFDSRGEGRAAAAPEPRGTAEVPRAAHACRVPKSELESAHAASRVAAYSAADFVLIKHRLVVIGKHTYTPFTNPHKHTRKACLLQISFSASSCNSGCASRAATQQAVRTCSTPGPFLFAWPQSTQRRPFASGSRQPELKTRMRGPSSDVSNE
jgi:hypothetical protein